MNALLIVLFLVIIIFAIYVVYYLNIKGFSSYHANDIWKSYPGKYEGFTSPSPVVNPAPSSYNTLDPFGLIDSSMDCPGSSYTNINGNICLNAEQRKLLTTRGGNSLTGTKYESEIKQ
jgi:hypothetical protein